MIGIDASCALDGEIVIEHDNGMHLIFSFDLYYAGAFCARQWLKGVGLCWQYFMYQ